MPDLSRRALVGELMDDPALDPREHRSALNALRRLNTFARSAAILRRPILALSAGRASVSILDVATGSGDLPVALACTFARRRSKDPALPEFGWHACDVSPIALAAAGEHAGRAGVTLELSRCDVLVEAPRGRYDIVVCSLFLHHLSEDDAVLVLSRLRDAARVGVVVSDLRRSCAGFALAWLASRVLTRSRIVHEDAARSVCAAFTPAELGALARRAGLEGATVARRWPQRMVMVWRRPA